MILLISQYRYPNGDAGAVRLYHFAKTLQNLGHKVLVIGMGDSTKEVSLYQGVPYLSLRTNNRYGSYLLYTWRLRKLLNRLGRENVIEGIVCGFTIINELIFLKFYCKRHNIKLIKDVVEWYSPQQFSCGKWNLEYQMKDIENRKVISPSIRVISISRYLENYFRSRHCSTVRIPIYFDVEKMPIRIERIDNLLHLVYAGSPGRKDYLYMMLEGMALLDGTQLARIRFTVVGVNQEQVETMLSTDDFNKIKPALNIRGRISHDEVLQILCQADFSILLRDSNARYAQAGFPTKVVESLSVGLPIICNYTSDLKEFLVDNENALIVETLSKEQFAETVKRAMNLSTEQKNRMSQCARQCAESKFNISSFEEEWKQILI